jgi:putative DNA primase/helicase
MTMSSPHIHFGDGLDDIVTRLEETRNQEGKTNGAATTQEQAGPILYRLPDVLKAQCVIIVEHEKDADTLAAMRLAATTNLGGAGKWRREHSEALRGKRVVAVIPDADAPGSVHAGTVARALLGVAKEVRLLKALPDSKDVTEWHQKGGTREQLVHFIKNTPALTPADLKDPAKRDREAKKPAAQDSWPDPERLGGELPPVEPFDTKMLPEALRPLVEDVAERMQVPIDLPAIVAVSSVAACVGRRATIRPKHLDPSWLVTPNLWGILVTPPGFMKSPTISAVIEPLSDIEALWRQEHSLALSKYGLEKEEAELRHHAWRDTCKAAYKNGDTPPPRPDNSTAEPVLRRLVTHDATFEKLHEILAHNPAGLFMVRDELSGWLSTLDKEGREGERAFFLTAWNGDSGFTMDRVGRGTIHVDHCCISMLGAITPARLCSYLADTLQDGPTNDGLMQRFQLAVYPDLTKKWTYVDRPPDANAMGMVEKMFRRLIALNVEQPLAYCYDPDAQSLFVEWFSELEQKLRNPSIHPVLVSHLAKYRKLQPALALLFELADDGSKHTVSLDHAKQAAAWCAYLESHARRIYSMIVSPQRQAAAELGRRLREGWKRQEGMFTVREVYSNDWSGLDTAEKVRPALEVLCDAGWTREAQPDRSVGRRTELFLINPHLYGRQS